jgi:hypothetical protein
MDIGILLIIIVIIINGYMAINILRYGMQHLGISLCELSAIIVFIMFPIVILTLEAKAIAILVREILRMRKHKK